MSAEKYRIGDVVRVRPDLEADKCYDDDEHDVSDEQVEHAGEQTTIERIHADWYDVDIDSRRHHYWCDGMFQLVKRGREFFPKRGDVVTVRRDLKEGQGYGTRTATDRHVKYAGQKVTIYSIDSDIEYEIDLDNQYDYWTREMFVDTTTGSLVLPDREIPILNTED